MRILAKNADLNYLTRVVGYTTFNFFTEKNAKNAKI